MTKELDRGAVLLARALAEYIGSDATLILEVLRSALARPQTSQDPNGVRLARMDAYDRWVQDQRSAD